MTRIVNGVDLIEIKRIEGAVARHGDRFLHRIFTRRELALTGARPASLAARFAAKEAVSKALGCGIGEIAWVEVEVLRGPNNQPELHLHGSAQRIAEEQHLDHWAISLSHSMAYAIAMVTAIGEQPA